MADFHHVIVSTPSLISLFSFINITSKNIFIRRFARACGFKYLYFWSSKPLLTLPELIMKNIILQVSKDQPKNPEKSPKNDEKKPKQNQK
jgi:hypothetical protein